MNPAPKKWHEQNSTAKVGTSYLHNNTVASNYAALFKLYVIQVSNYAAL